MFFFFTSNEWLVKCPDSWSSSIIIWPSKDNKVCIWVGEHKEEEKKTQEKEEEERIDDFSRLALPFYRSYSLSLSLLLYTRLKADHIRSFIHSLYHIVVLYTYMYVYLKVWLYNLSSVIVIITTILSMFNWNVRECQKRATQHKKMTIRREKDQTSGIFINEEVIVIDHVKRKGAKD
jgi:hypothetical protein